MGDQGSYSSGTTSVDEVEESLGWIYDLKTSGSLCLPAKNGMQVWVDGVALRGLDGVSGVVGIKLLPIESLSLCMSFYMFLLFLCLLFFFRLRDKVSIYTSSETTPKCLFHLTFQIDIIN